MFNIRMGIPEMQELWENLEKRVKAQTATKNEVMLFKKLISRFKKLANTPQYPGLCTHDIEALTKRYKQKVWQSYLENNKPAVGRVFWVYGPNKSDITIIGLEPHPNDKKDSYKKITLSATPQKNEKDSSYKSRQISPQKKKTLPHVDLPQKFYPKQTNPTKNYVLSGEKCAKSRYTMLSGTELPQKTETGGILWTHRKREN